MRRVALIALALVLGLSVAGTRLSGHGSTKIVSGPLASGAGGSTARAAPSTHPASLGRLGRATVRMARIAPTPSTALAHASHPQEPPLNESEAPKGEAVLP